MKVEVRGEAGVDPGVTIMPFGELFLIMIGTIRV
jgi:hypothetical protein